MPAHLDWRQKAIGVNAYYVKHTLLGIKGKHKGRKMDISLPYKDIKPAFMKEEVSKRVRSFVLLNKYLNFVKKMQDEQPKEDFSTLLVGGTVYGEVKFLLTKKGVINKVNLIFKKYDKKSVHNQNKVPLSKLKRVEAEEHDGQIHVLWER